LTGILNFSDGDGHENHDHEDPPPHYEDNQLAAFIDPVLQADDINNDGMIDFAEFIAAQLKSKAGVRKTTIEVSV